MSQLSFKGLTVVVTGAGGGLGKAYSLLFAERGANVVVNDMNKAAAQAVVDEITTAGGKAAVNSSNVVDGEAVVKTALDAFGGIHILINNAGILRDRSFKNMSDQEWDLIQLVHLKGAFACTKAAWPHFKKQKFGRIINTASAAGLYGNTGQANYSAAKMGLVAFSKTLAREGEANNIRATAIAPMAASKMTETIMPPEMLAHLKPAFVAPLVAALTHPDGPDASGKVYEVGAGFIAEIRWERSNGYVFKPDETYTPSAVKEAWDKIIDFTDPEHPELVTDFDPYDKCEVAKGIKEPNPQSDPLVRFDGKTVIVTGAGGGLGKAYALMYARLGANVVVNDFNASAAGSVVDEIKQAGGNAVTAVCSAEDGEAIVKTAIDAFGGVHVLVANAGILRDKSFGSMSEKDWDDVIAVHLRGTYKCCKAVWPIFIKQKYGRIVNTCSQVGLYGNFGQANYSAAKAGILGLTRTLSAEGQKNNIIANCIVPVAGTNMTKTVWDKEMVEAIKPDHVAPVVGFLTSDANEDTTGCVFEVTAGWAGQTRWQRAGGHGFPVNTPLTPEAIIAKWDAFTEFDDGRATNPVTASEAFQQIMDNFSNEAAVDPYADPEDPEDIAEAKRDAPDAVNYEYTERDVALYNVGVGATENDLQWTYEGHENFAAIPTFGVIPQFTASSSVNFDFLPNFNPAMLLHGEQYLAIKGPIPTSGVLVNQPRIIEVLDKGKSASITTLVETSDKDTGRVIFESMSTVIIRGSGGFGGKKKGSDRGPATAANSPPKRQPDAIVEEKTLPQQAALYRLSGDINPLHIVPEFAAMGGFDKPILHGLCSMGISAKHILTKFGDFQDIKVRFTGAVYPGETLVTLMWKEGNKVLFVTKVKERDIVVLAAAGATLREPTIPKAKL